MDDIASQINNILSDPESMKAISEIASMIGGGNVGSSPSPQDSNNPEEKNDTSQQSNTSGGATSTTNKSGPAVGLGGLDMDTINLISKLAPVLASFKNDDNRTALLFALRPFLSAEKQKKIDTAAKLLQLAKILPALKDSNILKDLL